MAKNRTKYGPDLKAAQARREFLRREAQLWPEELVAVPRTAWPERVVAYLQRPPQQVFRSREFLAVVYPVLGTGWRRLSVIRSGLKPDGTWEEGISWDDLQRVKREAGFGKQRAVELYPADADVVNVANMRHLWIAPDTARLPSFQAPR